jgi:hypothetical protein
VLLDVDNRILDNGCPNPQLLAYSLAAHDGLEPGRFLHDTLLTRLENDATVATSSGLRYRHFSFDRYEMLEGELEGGVIVRFGEDDDLRYKAGLVAPVIKALGPKQRLLRAVDLRAPSTPVVEYKS